MGGSTRQEFSQSRLFFDNFLQESSHVADSYGDIQEATYSFSRPPKLFESQLTPLHLCLGNLKDVNVGLHISLEIHHVTIAEETNKKIGRETRANDIDFSITESSKSLDTIPRVLMNK